jgi:hypothetical protein
MQRLLLFIVAILMLGVGQACGQLTCNHKEPGTDYPDGDYMSSTSSDPCGGGTVTLLSRQDKNNNSLFVNSGRLGDVVSQVVLLGFRGGSDAKESLPTVPFVITSNAWMIRRSKG